VNFRDGGVAGLVGGHSALVVGKDHHQDKNGVDTEY
jgi:hypothetical protein